MLAAAQSILSEVWESSSWTTVGATFIVILLLGNVKNLFGMWHLRLLSAIIKHLYIERSKLVTAVHDGGEAIFRPIVTSSICPLFECDINGHKSDSTYNADLDINRLHLIGTLFKSVLSPSNASLTGLGKLNIALGAVSVTFKAEIKPYERYEIYSRILTWDDKWIYIVSHFVRRETKTTMRPKQPIFASAISKYVFKRKRLTILPEEVLTAVKLLPPRLSVDANPSSSCVTEIETASREQGWTWEEVQAEKNRGYSIASHFAAMDQLHEEFIDARFKPLQRL